MAALIAAIRRIFTDPEPPEGWEGTMRMWNADDD